MTPEGLILILFTVLLPRTLSLRTAQEMNPAGSGLVDVVCNDDIDGGGWILYLYNGARAQYKNSLRLGTNTAGFGSVATIPTSGGHKMSEALFDAFQFTEVLAVGSDGNWVKIRRHGNAIIPSTSAFAVDSAPNIFITRSDSPSTETFYPRTGRIHGPFFRDPFGPPFGTWMWTDNGGIYDLRKGKVFGSPTSDLNYVWTWYGRSASSCLVPPSDPPTEHPTNAGFPSMCVSGVLNEDATVCCAASCGACGGCDCASLEGGADMCCPGSIANSETMCIFATDEACMLGVYSAVPNELSGCQP